MAERSLRQRKRLQQQQEFKRRSTRHRAWNAPRQRVPSKPPSELEDERTPSLLETVREMHARGGGALPHRESVEQFFGVDLSGLESFHAPDECAELDANAFAVGHLVAFKSPSPSPHSVRHEVAHVLQMEGHRQRLNLGSVSHLQLGMPGDRYEREADRLAHSTFGHNTLSPSPLAVRRQSTDDYSPNERAWNSQNTTGGTRVDKPGRIGGKDLKDGDTKRIYDKPLPGQSPSGHLAYNTRVWVEKKNAHGWYYVTAANGRSGWVQADWVGIQPADAEAELYTVQSGQELRNVVAAKYPGVSHLNQNRMFVEAVMWLNQQAGRSGVYREQFDRGSLSWGEWFAYKSMSESAQKTFEIWKTVRLRENHAIWLPSIAFVRALQAKGDIDKFGGSTKDRVMHSIASGLKTAWGWVKYGAAFVVGLVRGALESVYDLFKGMVDLAGMVWKVIKSIVTGQLKSDAKNLWKMLKEIDFKALGKMFLDKWNASDPWDKGMFRGRVCGYVIVEILLAIFSGGILTAVKWAGRMAKVSSLLAKFPKVAALAQKLSKAGELSKLPARARQVLQSKFGKAAGETAHVAGKTNFSKLLQSAIAKGHIPERQLRAVCEPLMDAAKSGKLKYTGKNGGGLRQLMGSLGAGDAKKALEDFAELKNAARMVKRSDVDEVVVSASKADDLSGLSAELKKAIEDAWSIKGLEDIDNIYRQGSKVVMDEVKHTPKAFGDKIRGKKGKQLDRMVQWQQKDPSHRVIRYVVDAGGPSFSHVFDRKVLSHLQKAAALIPEFRVVIGKAVYTVPELQQLGVRAWKLLPKLQKLNPKASTQQILNTYFGTQTAMRTTFIADRVGKLTPIAHATAKTDEAIQHQQGAADR